MLQRPSDWETTQAYTGEIEQLPPGGHICQILNARSELSKEKKKPMLVLALEIVEGSQHDGFYRRKYEEKRERAAQAGEEPPLWPCVYYQMLEKNDGSTNPFYKGLVESLERSNEGFQWDFEPKSLVGKMIGFVFGEEEFRMQNGAINTTVKPQNARSIEGIMKGVKVPPLKRLSDDSGYAFDPVAAGFTYVEDELPF